MTAKMDEFQGAVVSSPADRSILVRSCAGSGKSTTLAARAASLVGHGVAPDRILALTFSLRAKEDLEDKMKRALNGTPCPPRVMTHHAKALSILRAAGCTARVLEAGEQRQMLRKAANACAGRSLSREALREAVRAGLPLIARHKGAGTAPPAGSSERALLEAYQHACRASGVVDFEDMILLAAQALRQTGCPAALSFDHLLLDEAQDTSDSQFAMLQLLAPRDHVSVTAVGDADQVIYACAARLIPDRT